MSRPFFMGDHIMRSKFFVPALGAACAITISTSVLSDSCKQLDNQVFNVYDEPKSLNFSIIEPNMPLNKGTVVAQELLAVVGKGWRLNTTIWDKDKNIEVFSPGDFVGTSFGRGERRYCATSKTVGGQFCFSDTDMDGTPDTIDRRRHVATIGVQQAAVEEQSVDMTSYSDSLSADTKATDLPIFSVLVGRQLVVTKIKKKYVEFAISGGSDFVTLKTKGFEDIRHYGKDHKKRVDRTGAHEIDLDGFTLKIKDGSLVSISGEFQSPQATLECEGTRMRFKDSTITTSPIRR